MNNNGSPAPAQTASSLRILAVDDDIYIREIMVRTLSHLGYENVDTAYDGADAWKTLNRVSYSLVITDHKMPRVTGLELITRMRCGGMSQPVILISGTMPMEELNRNPDLRVDVKLPKPFTAAELAAAIGHLLRTAEGSVIADENQFTRAEQPAASPTRAEKIPPPRILVVDDNRASRQLQIELLRSSGYHVEAATDGAAGWEALRSHDYDLIITDNHMPKMTGLDLMENLHLSRMTTPVIMATGCPPTAEFVRKPWLKPEATLQKPYTNRELLDAISQVLGTDGQSGNPQATPLPSVF